MSRLPSSYSLTGQFVHRDLVRRFALAPAVAAIVFACYQDKPGTAATETSAAHAATPSAAPQAPSATTIPGLTPAPPDAPLSSDPSAGDQPAPNPAAGSDSTFAELMSYRLTTNDLQRWAKAQHTLNEVTRNDQALVQRMAHEAPPKTLDEIVARFDREPKLRQAFTDAGLSPRQYVKVMFAMQQAMQGFAMERSGRKLPAETPPAMKDNVAFVNHNMPTITKMMGELRDSTSPSVAP